MPLSSTPHLSFLPCFMQLAPINMVHPIVRTPLTRWLSTSSLSVQSWRRVSAPLGHRGVGGGVLLTNTRGFRQSATAQVDAHAAEQAELQKDRDALRRYTWMGGFGLLCVLTLWYGSRQAKQRYFGADGSARVSVETRGKPALGGPFVLVDTDGNPVSQADFLGSWAFFYFGFTHCPEICPVELNRMTHVVDAVRKARPHDKIAPLFVSCDPKRDSLEAIAEYLSVFHPDFKGLVGTPKQVHDTCKSYRIYYSMPSDEDAETEDYLIDHSIAIFLFDPQGRFVDFFGNRYDEHEIAEKVLRFMGEYEKDPTWTNW